MSNFYGQYIGFGSSSAGAGGPTFQGEISGYTHGGQPPGSGGYDRIDKFSFTTQANATDVANLDTVAYGVGGGFRTGTHGMLAGGVSTGYARIKDIQKYSHTADTNASNIGDLTWATETEGDVSDMGNGFGYLCGGNYYSPSLAVVKHKLKFSFVTGGGGTDIGDLTGSIRKKMAGATDGLYGYMMGGRNASDSGDYNTIDRWAYASGGDSVDVGNITVTRATQAGASSLTYGYMVGGYRSYIGGGNIIDKFAFSASADSTDVGNLTAGIQSNCAHSATSYGYSAQGRVPVQNRIERFSFTSDVNATDWADLTLARVGAGSSQI